MALGIGEPSLPAVGSASSQLMTGPAGGSMMRSAWLSRRQPPHRRAPPAPARSDNGLRAYWLTPNDPMGGLSGKARAPLPTTVVCFGVNPIRRMAFMSATLSRRCRGPRQPRTSALQLPGAQVENPAPYVGAPV